MTARANIRATTRLSFTATTYPMSVPLKVFIKAGFSQKDAEAKKKLFDEQEVQLHHLADGDVPQVISALDT